MAKWTHKLEIKDLHDSYQNGMPIEEVGREVAKRLRALITLNRPLIPEDLLQEAEDIALEFESMDNDVEEYDSILGRLYDWGDTELPNPDSTPFHQVPKLCWINTF